MQGGRRGGGREGGREGSTYCVQGDGQMKAEQGRATLKSTLS